MAIINIIKMILYKWLNVHVDAVDEDIKHNPDDVGDIFAGLIELYVCELLLCV